MPADAVRPAAPHFGARPKNPGRKAASEIARSTTTATAVASTLR